MPYVHVENVDKLIGELGVEMDKVGFHWVQLYQLAD